MNEYRIDGRFIEFHKTDSSALESAHGYTDGPVVCLVERKYDGKWFQWAGNINAWVITLDYSRSYLIPSRN